MNLSWTSRSPLLTVGLCFAKTLSKSPFIIGGGKIYNTRIDQQNKQTDEKNCEVDAYMAHTQNPKHNVIIKTVYMVGTMVQVTESCRSIYIYIYIARNSICPKAREGN